MTVLFARLSLLWAFAATPWLLAAGAAPKGDAIARLAWSGGFALLLNTLVPLSLHAFGVPLTALPMALTHWALGVAAVCATLLRGLDPIPARLGFGRRGAALFLVFALAAFPFSHLAGIDTYKWQDLATLVAVEQAIPWLTHPLGVFGYAPRAYPAMQPLVLATTQILGGLGVDGGFYAVSLLAGLAGLCGMFVCVRRLAGNERMAGYAAFLYVFSPIFLRYNHWATGRGLFLALFPLYLAGLADKRRLRRLAAALAGAPALLLTHRVALPTLALLATAGAAAALTPWDRLAARLPDGQTKRAAFRLLVAMPFLMAGLALSEPLALPFPLDRAAGFAMRLLTQMGPILVPAAFGLFGTDTVWTRPWRVWTLLGLFACAVSGGTMYAALPALFPVCLWAAIGLDKRSPVRTQEGGPLLGRATVRARMAAACLFLCGAAALSVVMRRHANATPRRIREAARFLDAYDPYGPFMLQAPDERARTAMQAYVRGCPRPDFRSLSRPRPAPPPRTPWRQPRRALAAWIAYGRRLVRFDNEPAAAYYGKNPKVYRVILDPAPNVHVPNGRRIYSENGVDIYEIYLQ